MAEGRAGLEGKVALLTRELGEAREQQAATASILRTLSSATFDLEAVLRTLVRSATDLCHASAGHIFLRDGEVFRSAMHVGWSTAFVEYLQRTPMRAGSGSVTARAAKARAIVHIPDVLTDPDYTHAEGQRIAGFRTLLGVPLLRDGEVVGIFNMARTVVQPFSEREIELVRTFSSQALIAIETVRLIDALKERTAALSESLQQQTATADVLKVISRSTFDLQIVLETLTGSAARLCDADMSGITRRQADGYYYATAHGFSADWVDSNRETKLLPGRGSVVGRCLLEGRIVQVDDVLADPDYTFTENQRKAGYRTFLGIPLLREGDPIGVLVLGRKRVAPFSAKQIELLETFADQAVIAIENVRLFDEVQAKSRDLGEALEFQQATSKVLEVIGRSASSLQPVLDAIVETAAELCRAEISVVRLLKDGGLDAVAVSTQLEPSFGIHLRSNPVSPTDRSSVAGRVALERRTVHIHDVLADAEYTFLRGFQGRSPFRTALGVPLLREGEVLGVLMLLRRTVAPFTDRQVALVQTFADQAVIAMENVRLFDAVKARSAELGEALRQQTATAEVLKVISRSALDLKSVLRTLVKSATEICEAEKATITRERDGAFYRTEAHGFSAEFMTYIRSIPVEPDRRTATGRVLMDGQAVHIVDVEADPEYAFREAQELGRFRSVLAVPMLRDGVPIGVLGLLRSEVRPFTEKQIELASTFADQGAIAIENARLFSEVQARTEELSRSLNELRAAQDRLVQTEKLASLGQLTAGIAHEIKNPLNFVNNFAALSVELVEELREALQRAHPDASVRAEIDEIAGMLGTNLEKVVQHGKRADSIVKNMLLHSRQGSGEHRPVDVNALVEESLNLAYHGARAERPGFNISLEKALDPEAGEADLYPQEITRVLLNLIANGFHATGRRAAKAGDGYEPTLTAATRDLGDSVEIRIRDNGTGIPDEVKAKMFNPFFTTKPAGEGTGLGLSLSHDIVVKQHGGRIEVDTEPGRYTEFRIVLPRGGAGRRGPGADA